MKIQKIDLPAAGSWPRDCELIDLSLQGGLKINYHKDEDNTYWSIQCEVVVGFKVIGEEFSRCGYLINLPPEGAFFEVFDSPWKNEIGKDYSRILDKCKHYIFQFYDQTIEVITQCCVFEQLKDKPI